MIQRDEASNNYGFIREAIDQIGKAWCSVIEIVKGRKEIGDEGIDLPLSAGVDG